MKQKPNKYELLISVIIPTINRSGLVCRAILSSYYQSYRNVEIIVINDFSQDDTDLIVPAFIKQNKLEDRVKYLKNTKNLGNAETRNVGIRNASGQYIAFLDDDDIWFPDKLEKQINEILKTKTKVCFCGQIWVEGNKVLQTKLDHDTKISFQNGGPTSTWLLHRSVFDTIGYFDSDFPSNVDGEFLVRLNKKYSCCFVDEPLYVHYYYESQISASNTKKIAGLEMLIHKHYKILNKYELSAAYLKLEIYYLLSNQKRFSIVIDSIRSRVTVNNLMILAIMLLPGDRLSRLALNRVLDYLNYSSSFAGRNKYK